MPLWNVCILCTFCHFSARPFVHVRTFPSLLSLSLSDVRFVFLIRVLSDHFWYVGNALVVCVVLCWCRPHGIFEKSKPVPATFTFCTFLFRVWMFRVLEVLFTHASVPKSLACHMRACLAIFFLYFSRCSFLVRLFLMLIYFIVHIVCCFFLFSSLGCSNGISFGVLSTFLRCANHYNFWHSFHHVVSSISLSLFFVHVRECERARARLHITR